MSFRRKENAHDIWKSRVLENAALLTSLPSEAIESEQTFRDYVTHGVQHGSSLAPSVLELNPKALDDLATFIDHKAQFDMDAMLFDDFKEALRRRHSAATDNAPDKSLERTREG